MLFGWGKRVGADMRKSAGLILAVWLLHSAAAMAQTAPTTPNHASDEAQDKTHEAIEVLSDTQRVDFGPYLNKLIADTRRNWFLLIPDEARPPQLKKGKVAIEFAILPDGKVAGMVVRTPSGDVALDRAAWGAITATAPFAPLPEEFHGPYLALRMRFYYNLAKEDTQSPATNPPGDAAKPASK